MENQNMRGNKDWGYKSSLSCELFATMKMTMMSFHVEKSEKVKNVQKRDKENA